MATQGDVRRICLAMPGVTEGDNDFAFGIMVKGKAKGFCWSWKERVDPKKPRVPNAKVLAVRTWNLVDKDMLIQAAPKKFFTEPHYNNYPAVLVRLEAITAKELKPLLLDACASITPKAKVKK